MPRPLPAFEAPPRAVGVLAAWLVVPLVLATCYEVAARYLFGAPTIWAFELGTMLMGAHFLLGAALTLAVGGHIRTDVLAGRLPARFRAAVDLLGYAALTLPMLAWLSWRLWHHLWTAVESGERTGASAWNPPVWPMRAVILAGFVLLTLQVAVEIAKRAGEVFAAPTRPVAEEEPKTPGEGVAPADPVAPGEPTR